MLSSPALLLTVHSDEIRKWAGLYSPLPAGQEPRAGRYSQSDRDKHGELHKKKNCMCVTWGEGYGTGRGNSRAGLALSAAKATGMRDAPVRRSG